MSSGSNRKLKIAIGVPEWAPFHGAMQDKPADATYIIQRNLSNGLLSRGHSLTFAAPINLDDFAVTSDVEAVSPARRSWTASPLFSLASKLVWRIQKLFGIPYLNYFSNYRYCDAAVRGLSSADVIYERNGLYNSGLAMAAKRLRLPYVIFFEADQIMELDIMKKPITGLLRRRAEDILRYNLSAADCIICVTNAGKRRLVNNWNVSAEKLVVFPNAVHVDRFKPDRQARESIRSKLGLKNEPVILFVGNFFHWHDVPTLLKAFVEVLKSHPTARLVLVGDGERRAAMIALAAELGLERSVIFTGIVSHSDVPHYMAAADIAVVPYPPMDREMWLSPLKLFEYMSAGLAVVASSIGQIVDVVEDGANGSLVPPGDVNAMTVSFERLLSDSDFRSKLGANARATAEKNFSWESYLARIERIFQAVIDRKPVKDI
ncbi:MAG TPA: glycosyltransferase family 4 protein [Anaerolineales bacterium]|nr:glycosyltransferase family 4 protein [Anaerolineales bacterium]